jgi:diguanylate cyclase (GGDEF)-like protein
MSRWDYTAFELLAVALGAAFGILLAGYSRTSHVSLERAYSGHLEELSQRLRTMAYQDALTGLYNHRYFYEQFSHEIERALRYGEPLTVLLMDMNNFKGINDTYGHMVGDKFLNLVGQVIAAQIRSSDIGARYGGDEFVVLLPSTTAEEAHLTAEKLSSAVTNAAAMSPNEERIHLGITIGVATCPDDSRSAGELLQIADARMFELKPKRRGALENVHRDVA